MRKIFSIILALVLVVSLTACGSNSTDGGGGGGSQKTETPLVVGEKHTVEEYAEFSLFKIQTTEKITGPVNSFISYSAPDGTKYVDLILDITNLSVNSISCDDIVNVSVINNSGAKYTCSTYIVESNGGTEVDMYTNIPPLTSTRLHCATAVNNAETAVTITLDVKGNVYKYDYILSDIVRNPEIIKVGDVLGNEDFAKINFNGAMYTDDLLPPNTSSYYDHYPIKNTSNTYLVVKFEITSYLSSARDMETFVGAKVTYAGKYSYTGFMVIEEDDGTGFDSYADLDPLIKYKAYILVEVPKTIMENEALIELSFSGKEYLYNFVQ